MTNEDMKFLIETADKMASPWRKVVLLLFTLLILESFVIYKLSTENGVIEIENKPNNISSQNNIDVK